MWLWLWAMLSRLLELLRTMWPFSLLSPAPAAVSVAGKAVLITGCDSGFGKGSNIFSCCCCHAGEATLKPTWKLVEVSLKLCDVNGSPEKFYGP